MQTSPGSILIVGDEPGLFAPIRRELSEAGFDCHVVPPSVNGHGQRLRYWPAFAQGQGDAPGV